MASRTLYTCDRCGMEVRRKEELRYFAAELDDDVDAKSAGARRPIGLEVCVPCGSMLMSVIQGAIENRGASE